MLNNHYLHFTYEEVETEVRSLARGHRASQKLQKWPGLDLAKAKEVTKQFGSLSQPGHSRHMESINSLFCGCPVFCRKFSSSPGLHVSVATPPCQLLLWQSKMPSDIPKCPLEGKTNSRAWLVWKPLDERKSMPTAPWQWHDRSGELHMTSVMCLGAGTIQGTAKSEVKGLSKNQITERYHNPQ